MNSENVMLTIIGVTLAIILWDIFLALDKKQGNTISAVLRAAGKKWIALIMFVAYGWGLLNGHWWWSVTVVEKTICP